MNKILRNTFIIIALAFIMPTLVSAAVSCAPTYSDDITGKLVTFTVSNDDTVGTYTYSWTTEGAIFGTGETVSKTFDTASTKSVRVSADDGLGGTEEGVCEVAIYNPADVSAPTINLCGPDAETAYKQQAVTWSADISGGLAPYSLTWTGTDGLNASGNNISYEYTATGTMSASLVVTSRYGTDTAVTPSTLCARTVTVYGAEIDTPDVANDGTTCSANNTSAYVDGSVTWNSDLHVKGGLAPYTISWSGTGGLSGNGDSITKTYSTVGEKTAKIISISSADGSTVDVNINCSNSVNIANRNSGSGSSHTSSRKENATSTNATTTATSATSKANSATSTATSTPVIASILANVRSDANNGINTIRLVPGANLNSTSTEASSSDKGDNANKPSLLSAAVGFTGENWPVVLYSLLILIAIGLIFWFFFIIKKSDQNK